MQLLLVIQLIYCSIVIKANSFYLLHVALRGHYITEGKMCT